MHILLNPFLSHLCRRFQVLSKRCRVKPSHPQREGVILQRITDGADLLNFVLNKTGWWSWERRWAFFFFQLKLIFQLEYLHRSLLRLMMNVWILHYDTSTNNKSRLESSAAPRVRLRAVEIILVGVCDELQHLPWAAAVWPAGDVVCGPSWGSRSPAGPGPPPHYCPAEQ